VLESQLSRAIIIIPSLIILMQPILWIKNYYTKPNNFNATYFVDKKWPLFSSAIFIAVSFIL